jgi:YVTN family beta-propeller protein
MPRIPLSILVLSLFVPFGADSIAEQAYECYSIQESYDLVNDPSDDLEPLVMPKFHAFGEISPDKSKLYMVFNDTPGVVRVTDFSDPSFSIQYSDIPVGSVNVCLAFTPDGDTAYICSLDEGMIYGLDTSTNTIVSLIYVGGQPNFIAITPDGCKAYVSDGTSTAITSIDLEDEEILAKVDVGSPSQCVAIAPDGLTAYVVRDGSPNGFVTSINIASDTVENDFLVTEHDRMMAIAPDGHKAYLINDTSTIDVMNLADGTLEPPSTLQIPIQGADSINITSDGSFAFVSGSGNLLSIDLSTNTVSILMTRERFQDFLLSREPLDNSL